ncbi:MAG: hypothetical protein EOP45_06325 [Sphingobacteriaceae bacterium]|nr:MAG: hypothetical protein EOP45_06325 [Sphingobacteriaceae bacterium]
MAEDINVLHRIFKVISKSFSGFVPFVFLPADQRILTVEKRENNNINSTTLYCITGLIFLGSEIYTFH